MSQNMIVSWRRSAEGVVRHEACATFGTELKPSQNWHERSLGTGRSSAAPHSSQKLLPTFRHRQFAALRDRVVLRTPSAGPVHSGKWTQSCRRPCGRICNAAKLMQCALRTVSLTASPRLQGGRMKRREFIAAIVGRQRGRLLRLRRNPSGRAEWSSNIPRSRT
jgi:hypothetical protein